MIYIYTGSNGSGKTLYSIKFICEVLNPDNQRPVFYFSPDSQPLNPNLEFIDWSPVSLDDMKSWDSFPDGSIFFIDEFRHVFPFRQNNQRVPDYIDKLSEHRSKGMDFVLTAQKPTGQFDPYIQGFIEEHRHMIALSGSKRCRHYVYESFCSSPLNPPALQKPIVENHNFDSKYFPYYKSASVHTKKDRLPYKKLIVFPVLFVLLILFLWLFYSSISSLTSSDSDNDSVSVPSVGSVSSKLSNSLNPSGVANSGSLSKSDWLELRKPRLPDLPSSAPLYDSLTAPVSFPRVAACLHNLKTDVCNCYTQQATPLDISKAACLNYVRFGYFDDTKTDSARVRDSDRETTAF